MFSSLPKDDYMFSFLQCVLASIIVVALQGLLMQVKDFFKFWKISRLDAIVWIATFLAVVIVSIDVGLLVGIILSLACIFIRSVKPYTCVLGNVPNTDLYLDIKRYKAVSLFFNYYSAFEFNQFVMKCSSYRLKKSIRLKFSNIVAV